MVDYNERLLYVTGFGAIVFCISCVILVVVPLLIPKWFQIGEWENEPPLLLNLFLFVLLVTAFLFYIRFVGKTQLTLYVMFKAILVCLLPMLTLRILYRNKSLERIIIRLKEQNISIQEKIDNYQVKIGEEEINIFSANKSDKFGVKSKNIVAIKSADNYVEIYFYQDEAVEKKLIRNTLKDIETQLDKFEFFIRCHRTCIVNIQYVKKLIRNYSGYSLQLKNYNEKLPVSRQYLAQVKESIYSSN